MLRAILFTLAFFAFSLPAAADKVGIGAWENSSFTTLNWIEDRPGLSWYYNWRTDQIAQKGSSPRRVEFVPMIHSAKDVDKRIVSARRVRTLLGFNEPDQNSGTHQAGMSVQQALALWPRLEKRGLRLGSPATTRDQTFGRGSWQRRFMDEAEKRGLRIDFMAVHYYSKDGDIDAFRRWLHRVHAEYNRPIWVTEFAMIDWRRPYDVTYEQNARFAEQAIVMMESLPFVERHAWFAANPYPWKGKAPRINLVDAKLRPTPVGLAFDRVLRRVGTRSVVRLSSQSRPDVLN